MWSLVINCQTHRLSICKFSFVYISFRSGKLAIKFLCTTINFIIIFKKQQDCTVTFEVLLIQILLIFVGFPPQKQSSTGVLNGCEIADALGICCLALKKSHYPSSFQYICCERPFSMPFLKYMKVNNN